MISQYNVRQLARIEDRLAKYSQNRLSFFALVADIRFFTSALQEPIGSLGGLLIDRCERLDRILTGLINEEEGSLRPITGAEQAEINQITAEIGQNLVNARREREKAARAHETA